MKGVKMAKQILKSSSSSTTRQYAVSSSSSVVVGQEPEPTIVFPREGSGGLNWALARSGVIVKHKAFYNLKSSELLKKGGIHAESLSGLPAYVRGDVVGGASKISKGDFNKLLKQVTSHISTISEVYVQDGAIGSSSRCDAKVRVISDTPSAALSLSNLLWKTPTRAVSLDSSSTTVYIANSISPTIGETIGLGSQESFLVADVDRSCIIICGKAFSDTENVKSALSAVTGPIISARGGLHVSAKLVVCGDSVVIVFASNAILKRISNQLVSKDDVILSSHGVSPLFQTGDSTIPSFSKLPSGIVIACSDSSATLPSAAKLSAGQVAYHFLAGYQNGKFVPAYTNGPSAIQPLDLAKSLLSKVKDYEIPSFLVNVNEKVTGSEFVKLVESTVSKDVSAFKPKDGKLKGKYKSFLSSK